MVKKISLLSMLILSLGALSQPLKLSLSSQEVQNLFLEQNLDLLAQKLEITMEQANLIQTKVWPNPTLEIAEVNLYKTKQTEPQPGLIGNWGDAQQIAIALSQEISTAGKRRKNIALAQLSIQEKQYEFEEILRSTKLGLFKAISELQLTQHNLLLYQQQSEFTQNLILAQQRQLALGSISKAELLRLKAAKIAFDSQIYALQDAQISLNEELKNYININQDVLIEISDSLEVPSIVVSEFSLEQWIEQAIENTPIMKLSTNQHAQALVELQLEKAERIPDLTLSLAYDRASNINPDFISIGLSFDVPLWNHNKGNIKKAQAQIDQAKVLTQQAQTTLSNQIIQSYRAYAKSKEFYDTIDPSYEADLDQMVQGYYNNFKNRNVSLIEYLDFMDAYLENKTALLQNKKDLLDQFYTLEYAIGQEL